MRNMLRNMLRRAVLAPLCAVALVLLVGGLAACGSSTEPTPLPHDPYATAWLENQTTPAGGARYRAYDFYWHFMNPGAVGGPVARQATLLPGDRICGSLAGYPDSLRAEFVVLTDTIGAKLPEDQAIRDSVATGDTTWTGVLRLASPVFDPLVSTTGDTTIGATQLRPVRWRITLTDTGLTVREDSTTGCNF